MTTKEIMEIILGGAAVLLLIVLLYNLISPNFDVGDETAKVYFDSLEEQIAVADKEGGVGSFSIWLPRGEDDEKEFLLVYFGNHSSRKGPMRTFYSLGNNVNHICICSWDEGEDKCNYCKNLDLPVVRERDMGETWAVGIGPKFEIRKMEEVGYYEFKKVS